jgi:hypothetical protein
VDFPFENLVGASGHLVVTYEVRDGPISSIPLAISWGIKDFDKSNSDCSSTHLSLTTEPKPSLQSENSVVRIYVARLFSAASSLLFSLALGSRLGAEGVALGFNLATDSFVAWHSRNLALNSKWASGTNNF